MNLKPVFVAAVLALSALGMARADTVTTAALSPVSGIPGKLAYQASFHSLSLPTSGVFTDLIGFLLPSGASTTAAYDFRLNLSAQGVTLATTAPLGSDAPSVFFNSLPVTTAFVPAFSASFGALVGSGTTAPFTLSITGLTTDAVAAYSGTLTVLTPVPEPGALMMMLAGLGSIGFVAWRRRLG